VVGIVAAAVGSAAAVIAIPELHDLIFGSMSKDHPVAPLPPTTIPPQPGKTDLEKNTLRTRAATLVSDAQRLHLAGRNDQARAGYGDARLLYQQAGDKLGEANALLGLGDLERKLGHGDPARADYGDALILYQQAGGKLGEQYVKQRLASFRKVLSPK
jgi:tetratricopeptide (TPR) repeat protein